MGKLFEDVYTPLEITMKTVEGKTYNLKSNLLTGATLEQVEIINNDENKLQTHKIFEMMSLYFNKPVDFWKKFSMDLLGDVAVYVQEEAKKKL